MKNLHYGLAGLVISLGLSGCGGISWVNLDNSKAETPNLKTALKKCKVDEKRYKLNEEQNQIDMIVSVANIKGKAKKQWEDISKQKEVDFYKDIDECMNKEGFKREK